MGVRHVDDEVRRARMLHHRSQRSSSKPPPPKGHVCSTEAECAYTRRPRHSGCLPASNPTWPACIAPSPRRLPRARKERTKRLDSADQHPSRALGRVTPAQHPNFPGPWRGLAAHRKSNAVGSFGQRTRRCSSSSQRGSRRTMALAMAARTTGGCDVSRHADLFDEVRASQPRF